MKVTTTLSHGFEGRQWQTINQGLPPPAPLRKTPAPTIPLSFQNHFLNAWNFFFPELLQNVKK